MFCNNSYLAQLLQTADTQHKPYAEGALPAILAGFSLFTIQYFILLLLLRASFFTVCVSFTLRLCLCFLTTEASQRILRALPQSSVFPSERVVVVGNFELKLFFILFFLPAKPPSVLTHCCPCISE